MWKTRSRIECGKPGSRRAATSREMSSMHASGSTWDPFPRSSSIRTGDMGSDLTRQTGGDDDRCGDSRGASILPPTFDRGRGEASGTPEGFWRSDSEDCSTRRRHDRSRRAASHRSADPVPGRYGILLANAAGPTGTPTSTVCWDRESPAPPRSLTPCRAGTRRSDGKSSDEPTSFPSDGTCRDRRAAGGRGSLPYPADGGESSWHRTGIISGTRVSVSGRVRPEFASGACNEVCPLPAFARPTVEAAVPEEGGVRHGLATAAGAGGHFAISEPPLRKGSPTPSGRTKRGPRD